MIILISSGFIAYRFCLSGWALFDGLREILTLKRMRYIDFIIKIKWHSRKKETFWLPLNIRFVFLIKHFFFCMELKLYSLERNHGNGGGISLQHFYNNNCILSKLRLSNFQSREFEQLHKAFASIVISCVSNNFQAFSISLKVDPSFLFHCIHFFPPLPLPRNVQLHHQ